MSLTTNAPPVALTIAGSDPSGGAGLQADLKAFAAHGVYGLSAVTCTTAQVPGEVSQVAATAADHLAEQIRLLLRNFPVSAIKTGMLYSAELIETVVGCLPEDTPLVVDPVMVATSGDPLLQDDAVACYCEQLFPRAALVTPNLDEAAVLLDSESVMGDPLGDTAQRLLDRYKVPFLLKGGHLKGDQAIDVLITSESMERFEAPYVHGVSTHGTGCTYSTAIAANLAKGLPLRDAVARAKNYITAAIEQSFHWPNGLQALNHSVPAS